ncbi:YfhO family protein [Lactobacillus sp. PSON]|uniref:YfhO family protein n=1 Tax=Lactobacillus sp. PSON TaxID=3455454 RepID=UPI00404219E7
MIQQKFKTLFFNLFNKKTIFYYCSFFIPFFAFFGYFLLNNCNILTVDLGQQYIDFFAFLKHSFTSPLNFIYSFQNGLGSSMLATSSYYLLSPFNLLFIFFNSKNLPSAVLLIISLKISFCGFSSFYYWNKKNNKFAALGASSVYALSGYIIANHFNLMWLDSAILLPFLIRAIDKNLNKQKNHLILVTFLLWFTNFYTGFMALFFGFLYFLSQIYFFNDKVKLFLNYLKNSISGSFLASFTLLPTFFEMLTGKATTSTDFSWGFQFAPYEQILKLSDGAYNFQEMESGLPNIFITMPFLLLVIAYFLSKNIPWKNKLSNGVLFIFLTASLFWTPLVLLWHMGQFPVWYPGRFSFIWIFFALNLGMIFLQEKTPLLLWQKIFITLIALSLIIYWTFNQENSSYITHTNLIISGLFLIAGILFLTFIYGYSKFSAQFLATSVILEIIINMILSLNNLSYQKNTDYQNFTQNTTNLTSYLNKYDSELYRTEKTFYRSDDDPFTANYNGITNFNSISNQKVLTLLANLGYLHNSNSYTNFGGTLLTDDLLGIRYYIEPNYVAENIKKSQKMSFNNLNHRLDLDNYHLVHEFPQLLLLKNANTLPLAFLTNSQNHKPHLFTNAPITNQERLYRYITNNDEQLFTRIILPNGQLTNLSETPGNWMEYSKKQKTKASKISFNIKLKTNDSYYLELPATLSAQDCSLFVNGAEIVMETRDSQARLINVANNQKGQNLHIVFNPKNPTLNLSELSLWHLQTQKLNKSMQEFNKYQPKIKQINPIVLSAFVKTKKSKTLATTIPYSKNWLVFDNGHLLKLQSFVDTFLSVHINKGSHQIIFVYIPFALIVGLFLSLITLIILRKTKV